MLWKNQPWKLGLFHVIAKWKSIYYFACGLEIPPSRTKKPRTYVNHGFTSEENNRFGNTGLFLGFQ